jgi:Transglutaminase-like superfamily
MSTSVSCPDHLRSVDVGPAMVLVDLRTGSVHTLLGWAHLLWTRLARAGELGDDANLLGVGSTDLDLVMGRWYEAGLLNRATDGRGWRIIQAPRTQPSWGTQEVQAAVCPRGRGTPPAAVLAATAISAVLLARSCGSRTKAFARILRLITWSTRRRTTSATPADVARALDSVRSCAALLPCRFACLEETAAAMLLLAFTGRGAGWCHGIAADPIRLHAWLTLDGCAIAEPTSTDLYAPILHIPPRD